VWRVRRPGGESPRVEACVPLRYLSPVARHLASLSDLTDGQLASRIAGAGASAASEEEAELCRRFERRVVYFARRRMASDDLARDLAQDTLLLTLQKLRAGEVRDPDRIGAFILGVARTLSISAWRRDAPTEPLDEAGARVATAADERGDPIAGPKVAACLEALPEKYRTVVMLSFYAERTSTEVAKSLGTTSTNVRVIRHRSLALLRDCLGLRTDRDTA